MSKSRTRCRQGSTVSTKPRAGQPPKETDPARKTRLPVEAAPGAADKVRPCNFIHFPPRGHRRDAPPGRGRLQHSRARYDVRLDVPLRIVRRTQTMLFSDGRELVSNFQSAGKGPDLARPHRVEAHETAGASCSAASATSAKPVRNVRGSTRRSRRRQHGQDHLGSVLRDVGAWRVNVQARVGLGLGSPKANSRLLSERPRTTFVDGPEAAGARSAQVH